MDKNLKKSINRAYHMVYSKDSFLGLTIMLIFSKELFPTNKTVSEFIYRIFDLEFLNYALRSRTLMVAKLARKINDMNEDELKKRYDALLFDLRSTIELTEGIDVKRSNTKKKNAINNLNKWFSMKKESDE
ncbi:hypothetical protein RBA63_13855 [Brenneria goodwinii]|uniref:hypothetical protein n=1 Tax=Brenneria goodwinii TaxID=1109412 RepID=UPI0036EE19F2